jgi:hypothetical protein
MLNDIGSYPFGFVVVSQVAPDELLKNLIPVPKTFPLAV